MTQRIKVNEKEALLPRFERHRNKSKPAKRRGTVQGLGVPQMRGFGSLLPVALAPVTLLAQSIVNPGSLPRLWCQDFHWGFLLVFHYVGMID